MAHNTEKICLTPWDAQSKRVYRPDGAIPALCSGTNEGINIQPIVLLPNADTSSEHFYSVRRLTPVECERLQGFPDGWTDLLGFDERTASDTGRYRALGNSMAVPVICWIGKRLDMTGSEER